MNPHARLKLQSPPPHGSGAPGLTSGAAEGGVPGQREQPAESEQQSRQEGHISEPHLRKTRIMSAPRGGERDRERGAGTEEERDGETDRQVQTAERRRRSKPERRAERLGAMGERGGKRERGREGEGERDGEGKQRFKHLQTSIIAKFNDPTLTVR